jgi:Fe2+ transport system protein FeoA
METTSHRRRLSHLKPGDSGVIDEIALHKETALKLMQIGLWPGEDIKVLRMAPFGGPMEIELMGYRLAIRRSDAEHIFLR